MNTKLQHEPVSTMYEFGGWRSFDAVVGRSESASDLSLEHASVESEGAAIAGLRFRVRLKDRIAVIKEVFPKRSRARTFSYVFISYVRDACAIEAPNAELTRTWKALDAEEISRPIAREEIVRRQADDFLALVYQLDATGDVQTATDRLFDYIDRLLHLGMFEIVNEVLKQVRVEKLSTSLMRSLLTITVAAKRHLIDRDEFYERVEREMTNRRGPDMAKRLLGRLA